MRCLIAPFSLLSLLALSGCVASVDAAARARAEQDLSCPESRLSVGYLRDVGPETVEVTGCNASARYTCVVSEDGAVGRYARKRVCIREAEPLKQMVGTEEIRTLAK
jgi:hypothetical protein